MQANGRRSSPKEKSADLETLDECSQHARSLELCYRLVNRHDERGGISEIDRYFGQNGGVGAAQQYDLSEQDDRSYNQRLATDQHLNQADVGLGLLNCSWSRPETN